MRDLVGPLTDMHRLLLRPCEDRLTMVAFAAVTELRRTTATQVVAMRAAIPVPVKWPWKRKDERA